MTASAIEDPGWRPAAKGLLYAFVPTLGARRLRRDSALIVLRSAWCSFAAAMCLIGVVVIVLWASDLRGSVDGRAAAIVVAVVGVVAQLSAGRVVGPLAGDDEATAVSRFGRSFFLRVALAEVGALVGFVGFILSGNPAVYFLGFVITAAGLSDAAPTAARIDAQQQQLRAAGSAVELLPALLAGKISG